VESLGRCLATPFPVFPRVLTGLVGTELSWFPERGCGYYPATGGVYDADYFAKYQGYARTAMGSKLNIARIAMVARHYNGPLVDIGIGCGAFIDARRFTWGHDINPAGIAWLKAQDKWWNPWLRPCVAASFWDSLEHIADFPKLLERVEDSVFVSIPIFRNLDDVLTSKHYRKDEHHWYFTRDGLIEMMRGLGWRCIEANDMESFLGREGIGSFVFRRKTK
jgi:hypothetical protein